MSTRAMLARFRSVPGRVLFFLAVVLLALGFVHQRDTPPLVVTGVETR